jgi:hypothetical protein
MLFHSAGSGVGMTALVPVARAAKYGTVIVAV